MSRAIRFTLTVVAFISCFAPALAEASEAQRRGAGTGFEAPIGLRKAAGSTSISRARPSRSAISTAGCFPPKSPTSCG